MQRVYRVLSQCLTGLGGVLLVLALLQVDQPVRGDTTSQPGGVCVGGGGICANATCNVACPKPPILCACPGGGGGA